MRALCVIGLGLIGGSVLRAAAAAGRPCWGSTESAVDANAARADGFDITTTLEEALTRAAAEDALVVLAVPATAVRSVLREIAWHAPDVWLTDVISVKDAVAAEVRSLLPGARYAGGHPMAGSTDSGWGASSADLFQRASWAVTLEEETSIEAWREAAQLALDCGARVVPTTAGEHDDVVGRISHLPHVLAAILASVGADGGDLALSLAAGSFRDGTRVAASKPDLVCAMTEGNRPALLDAVDDALGRLGAARGALASTGSLKSTVDAGHAARSRLASLDHRIRKQERISFSADSAGDFAQNSAKTGNPSSDMENEDSPQTRATRQKLLNLGHSGGWVMEITNDTIVAEVPDLPAVEGSPHPDG